MKKEAEEAKTKAMEKAMKDAEGRRTGRPRATRRRSEAEEKRR